MKIAAIAVLLLTASLVHGTIALAQGQPPRGGPAGPHPPAPGGMGAGPGMMGGPPGMMGRPEGSPASAFCPVPLMAGGQLDARALQMCGEILRAVGDIMMRYGKAMEGPPR